MLKPLGDRVIVKAVTEDLTTKSGIILPDTIDKEKPEKGEVIAVGLGKILDNGQRAQLEVRVGDQVVFSKYGPIEVKIKGEVFLILNESDILAIIQ